jgi:hypothetical protein
MTTNKSNSKPTPSTPEERAAEHQRQMRLQVWLPLGISLLLVLSLAGWALAGTIQGSSEVNRWGSISAVLLLIPNLLTSLISAAILILTIRGLSILHKKLPGWLYTVQALFARVAAIIHIQADRIVTPVMGVGSLNASVNAIKKKIIH